jgi:hypothetical protein
MSSHAVELLEYRKLSDGQFAVLGRCCGDDMHRSWHTMGSAVVVDADKMSNSISWFTDRIANQHEAAMQADAVLKTLVGTTVTIPLPVPADPAPADPVAPAPASPDGQPVAA